MGIYVYLNRYLADPLYHAKSFWTLPCNYLEAIVTSLQQIEKDRLQAESVTTAYLTDSLHSIAHALYGDKSKPYTSNPALYLPGYEAPARDEDQGEIEPTPETIAIFLAEYKARRLPTSIVAHFAPLLNKWTQQT